MDAADTATIFDQLVASARQRASTTTSTPRGLVKIAIRQEPTRAAQPEVERELGSISPDLRLTIRALVTGEQPWPLYLWGPAGTGKTSAALVMLDYCGARKSELKLSPVLADWRHGFIDVRTIPGIRIGADKGQLLVSAEGRSSESIHWPDLLARTGSVPLIVFDEIGVGRDVSDFRLDALLELLNCRANNPVKPFIVTSNLAPSEVAKVFDDRIADRIMCGTVKKVDGDTRRMNKPH